MVALKGRSIQAFVQKPDANIAAVLVYGPDSGLARERADGLARRVVADFRDPFNYIELADADLKTDPARLADEAAALSFAGGQRIVRLRTAGDASAAASKNLIDALDAGDLKSNALVIIEAGELAPRSALRKMFERAKHAAALPCYADKPAEIRALAVEAARAENLQFDNDALDLLASLLGDDRGVSRAEIDKLILLKGAAETRQGPGTITVEDVRTSLVDSVGAALDEAAAACADGAPTRLARAMHQSAAAGAGAITLLRALQRGFARLEAAQAFVAKGETPASAMKKLRPPVFFAEHRAFEARLRKWPRARLARAQRLLVDAELDAKTTGAPQREIVERAALRLAVMARR
ncbi:MAG: DNA polymerase III subunit delta [Parvularculaceae bacterium]